MIDEILAKVDAVKSGERSPRARGTVASAIIGGLAGLMIGYSKKWNLFYSILGGAVTGTIVGAVFIPKSKKTTTK
jgi:hypothetical protein